MTNKELFDKLSYKRKNVYEVINETEINEMQELCTSYRTFLDIGKTERECVDYAIELAKKNGFEDIESKSTLKAGDKIYAINRGKYIMLMIIGSDDIENGLNIVGAHVDSPRIDLKQNPLYEADDMALFKTHYYGGIKKYQWTTIPLSMHGVIYTKEGKKVTVSIGEKEDEPVFCITDLLPHLAVKQMSKKMTEGIEGENLNILVGGMPIQDSDINEKVKFTVLKHLNDKYGICERDFQTAEIEMVPAFKARNIGFDESFIGAYGQDDRVCAYTALQGIFDINAPKKTAVTLLVDKEEIGSMGNTGMKSAFFEMTVARVIEMLKGNCSISALNKVISNSACLSSDVNAAVDPTYEYVTEKKNASFCNGGVVFTKFTGSRGKSGSSDASAEFVSQIARIMDEKGIVWQTGELGKVDEGGGGTIAQYVANLNMEVIDAGVPVLSMHAPFEIVAKGDIYMAYKAYKAFFENN
ncbi:MAG: aminopeptidase [Clostridia bacterium]|nr:aminopeptidase [Clostridia bacterium]